MSRTGYILAAFVLLSTWVGAQGPAPTLTAADHLRLLRANRNLLATLVTSEVELADVDRSPVSRAESCQQAARVLGAALREAATGPDADRVTELGDHLDVLVRDSLIPVLDEARRLTPPESADAAKLKAVRESAAGDLDGVRAALPAAGKGDAAKLRGKFDELREKLK